MIMQVTIMTLLSKLENNIDTLTLCEYVRVYVQHKGTTSLCTSILGPKGSKEVPE